MSNEQNDNNNPTKVDEYEKDDDINENIKELFDQYDLNKTGFIELADIKEMFSKLGKDLVKIDEQFVGVDKNEDSKISFEEFQKLFLNSSLINQDADDLNNAVADQKVIEFLKLLDEYRKKCESENNQGEAKKAKSKQEELRKKEEMRQVTNIKSAQEAELNSIETAQKQQFLEFSQAWDNYMADYETTAYLSLEKLKEKHVLEFQQFSERVRKETRMKLKFSRELLELRKKQNVLAKQKKYAEAEKIKSQSDSLEEWERQKMETEFNDIIERKETRLKHAQQLALAALLKRIQRDRNEQLRHRQIDSQRLIQRNKNLRNDLLQKQRAEAAKTIESIRTTLGMSARQDDDIQMPIVRGNKPMSSRSVKSARKNEE